MRRTLPPGHCQQKPLQCLSAAGNPQTPYPPRPRALCGQYKPCSWSKHISCDKRRNQLQKSRSTLLSHSTTNMKEPRVRHVTRSAMCIQTSEGLWTACSWMMEHGKLSVEHAVQLAQTCVSARTTVLNEDRFWKQEYESTFGSSHAHGRGNKHYNTYIQRRRAMQAHQDVIHEQQLPWTRRGFNDLRFTIQVVQIKSGLYNNAIALFSSEMCSKLPSPHLIPRP